AWPAARARAPAAGVAGRSGGSGDGRGRGQQVIAADTDDADVQGAGRAPCRVPGEPHPAGQGIGQAPGEQVPQVLPPRATPIRLTRLLTARMTRGPDPIWSHTYPAALVSTTGIASSTRPVRRWRSSGCPSSARTALPPNR